MSVGVSLPHFTSPSSNGGQIGFFFSLALTLTLKKKKNGGTLALTLKKKKYTFFLSITRVHSRDTSLHSHDTFPLHYNESTLACQARAGRAGQSFPLFSLLLTNFHGNVNILVLLRITGSHILLLHIAGPSSWGYGLQHFSLNP